MFPLVLHSLLCPGSALVSRASLRSAHPYPTARREILMRLYVWAHDDMVMGNQTRVCKSKAKLKQSIERMTENKATVTKYEAMMESLFNTGVNESRRLLSLQERQWCLRPGEPVKHIWNGAGCRFCSGGLHNLWQEGQKRGSEQNSVYDCGFIHQCVRE